MPGVLLAGGVAVAGAPLPFSRFWMLVISWPRFCSKVVDDRQHLFPEIIGKQVPLADDDAQPRIGHLSEVLKSVPIGTIQIVWIVVEVDRHGGASIRRGPALAGVTRQMPGRPPRRRAGAGGAYKAASARCSMARRSRPRST